MLYFLSKEMNEAEILSFMSSIKNHAGISRNSSWKTQRPQWNGLRTGHPLRLNPVKEDMGDKWTGRCIGKRTKGGIDVRAISIF